MRSRLEQAGICLLRLCLVLSAQHLPRCAASSGAVVLVSTGSGLGQGVSCPAGCRESRGLAVCCVWSPSPAQEGGRSPWCAEGSAEILLGRRCFSRAWWGEGWAKSGGSPHPQSRNESLMSGSGCDPGVQQPVCLSPRPPHCCSLGFSLRFELPS